MKNVKAVFDIGKTNKKFLLFDKDYNVVHQKSTEFDEIEDEDGFACEDVDTLVEWIENTLVEAIKRPEYDIKSVNFTTYGATLVYLDEKGQRVTPVYNYLKPVDEKIFDEFYEKYEGQEEFCRKTASPALGMLNSGLQMYWLKNEKPEYWKKVQHVLHFPQYLSYLFTEKIVSEYTSIGCHTGMWNFDDMKYHYWLEEEGISLPEPFDNSTQFEVDIEGKKMDVGIGIHDSSASLVPFLKQEDEEFILISSGTWAINLNPFNSTNLTKEQLDNDCLCYLSIDQEQVKASRLFMGHIHDKSIEIMNDYFDESKDKYKHIEADSELIDSKLESQKLQFFEDERPTENYLSENDLDEFDFFKTAYHQLMYELSYWEAEQINRVIENDQKPQKIYISGGFVNNDLFVEYIDRIFEDIIIQLSEIDNGTALGAAMVLDD